MIVDSLARPAGEDIRFCKVLNKASLDTALQAYSGKRKFVPVILSSAKRVTKD